MFIRMITYKVGILNHKTIEFEALVQEEIALSLILLVIVIYRLKIVVLILFKYKKQVL